MDIEGVLAHHDGLAVDHDRRDIGAEQRPERAVDVIGSDAGLRHVTRLFGHGQRAAPAVRFSHQPEHELARGVEIADREPVAVALRRHRRRGLKRCPAEPLALLQLRTRSAVAAARPIGSRLVSAPAA